MITAAVENKAACTCGKILGSHCGGRMNIPYEYGLYALTGDCIPTGYYNCPAIDRAPEFKGICNTCQQSDITGKDSCHVNIF
ncbi:unnamed protein product [Medioppia subpectinata]|uniref:Uncharacterized protein n=1 Tax=Medioppia subpectinata TaxID=1979941 RepID=A0A7R9PUG7_9ACAR|nr:unnamed protein product [Medioppia subpectinata]CAG2101748.1 unnamed protein product [Medioppia subpectinata]